MGGLRLDGLSVDSGKELDNDVTPWRASDGLARPREPQERRAGNLLFGWFLLFLVIWGFKEHPWGTAILLAIAAGWYVRRQLEKEEQRVLADQGA